MKKQEIQSFGEAFNGKTPSKAEQRGEGLPILKIRDIDENGQFRGVFESFVDPDFYEKHSKKKLKTGDTIILNAAHNSDYVGSKNAFVPQVLNGVIATGEWLIVRVNEANPAYINQFLKSPGGRKSLKNCVKGIHLYPKDVERIGIPLPQPDDQIRIAHLLGKVEGLIALRKQNLQQLDDLLKSVFLEMFGDPVRNERGWTLISLSKLLLDIESGNSPVCEARKASADEWGVLKLGAVTKCYFQENENKALPAGIAPQIRHEVKEGDLLFGRKNTYELVGACAYVFKTRKKLLMPDLIFRFVFRDDAEINPIFIWKLLTAESQRKKIQSLAAGAAGSMPNISKTNLKQAVLPIPPIALQNKFAVIVEKLEGIKARYQHSLTELEALYGALSQQAFKGELDLSRVAPIAETGAAP